MTELSSIAYKPPAPPEPTEPDNARSSASATTRPPPRRSRWAILRSNIKEFMTARPVIIKGARPSAFDNPNSATVSKITERIWKPDVRGT